MSGWSARLSVPLGPLTVIVATVDGRRRRRPGRGWEGVRFVTSSGLPDVGQDFAAELGLAGLRAGHDPLAGADDDDAEAAEDPRDLGLARVDAQAGLADALEPGDDRDLAVDVLERRSRRTVARARPAPRWTSAMKPSSLRMRAISRLVREAGTTTSAWRARDALRMRVSMSAIGSEMFIGAPTSSTS